MPSMGTKLQLGDAGSLNFSALTALPSGRQSAVTTAANTAAATLGMSAQSVIDAAGRCPEWWDWQSNTFTDAAATVPASTGNAVQAFRGVRAGLLATQPDAVLRPALGAGGIVYDSDQLVSPSTGFPTGDNAIGAVAIINFSASQPGANSCPFIYGGLDFTSDRTGFLLNQNFLVGLGGPFLGASQLGVTGSSFYYSYSPSPREVTLRNALGTETTVSLATAPALTGLITLGGYRGQLLCNCTIRQLAWINSVADARIMHIFLRALEGL